MGNTTNKKKKGDNENKESIENQTNKENKEDKEKEIKEIKEALENQDKKYKINIKLINKQVHSKTNDKIEEVITIKDLPDTIIIGCRSGSIKEVAKILSFHDCNDNSNIKELYSFSNRLYSLILLKNNKLCVGLENMIVLLELKLNENHFLKKVCELTMKEEGPINSLLELENGKIISAGKNIILWEKKSSVEYKKIKSIPIGYYNIINLIEFPNVNTIIATQENTHSLYLLKNEGNTINLIEISEKVASIGYKGSAQNLSKRFMLLVGKFELNVVDGETGEIASRYPGIDRGTLLNMTQKRKEDDFWIVSHYMGEYFEFYKQDGNDLIFYEKIDLKKDENYRWGHKLVKINDEYFAATNHYGYIYVYKIIK